MARKLRASRGFLQKNDDSRITTGYAIGNSITTNADKFEKLTYRGIDLNRKTDELKNGCLAAKTGDRKAIADLKVIRADWKTMFGLTADEVSLQANGVEAIIIDAGMTATSGTSRKKPQPEQPSNTVAKPGKGRGNCALSVDAQKGVNGYVGLLTSTDAKIEWTGKTIKITPGSGPIYLQAGTRREMLIDGLPSYTTFCGTIFTFNSAGSSPLSNSEEMGTQ